MSLVGAVIGVLANNNDFDVIERGMTRPDKEIVRILEPNKVLFKPGLCLPRVHVFCWWEPFIAFGGFSLEEPL